MAADHVAERVVHAEDRDQRAVKPAVVGAFERLALEVEFELLVADDELIRRGADADPEPDRIAGVDDHHPDDQPDRVGVDRVLAEPLDHRNEPGVEEEIVTRSEQKPKDRKQRADHAHHVAEAVGIIPEFDVQTPDEDHAGHKLDQGERHADHGDPKKMLGDAGDTREIEVRQPVQEHHAEAVERDIGSDEKAGVDPLFRREEAAVKDLENVTGKRPENEERRDDDEPGHWFFSSAFTAERKRRKPSLPSVSAG